MGSFFSRRLSAVYFALGLFAVALTPTMAKAQIFCPPAVNSPAGGQPGLMQSGGTCTNGNTGAYSGAALASQSLGNLASTTTQIETTVASRALAGRRAEEAGPCPAGETRINGICVAPATRKTLVAPTRVARPIAKTVKTVKIVKVAKHMPDGKVRMVRRRVRVVSKETEVETTPAPIPFPEGGVVFDGTHRGVWVQGYGDYERRTGAQTSSFNCCTNPANTGGPIPLLITATSETTTYGVVGGIDWAARGLAGPNDGVIVGLLTGYMHSQVDVNVNTISGSAQAASGSSHFSAQLDGPSLGAYASYYNGPFSSDFLIKNDFLNLGESFNDSLGFGLCTCFMSPTPAYNVAQTGSGQTHLNQITISETVNYRIPMSGLTWFEPTAAIQFTDALYDSSAALLGLKDGDAVRLQAGGRVGMTGLFGGRFLTTTVTGLIFDDVLVRGNFIQGGVFGSSGNILNDEGKVQGEGILAFNYDLGGGLSSFVQADVRGGDGIFGVGGKGGIRLQW